MKVFRARIVAVLVLLPTLVTSACDGVTTTLEPDPETVSLDDILELTNRRSPAQMPADGVSEDTLTARIPKDAQSRDIEFETTGAGTFVPWGETGVTVRATPDPEDPDRLVATVRLKADTTATDAFIRATIEGFTDTLTIKLTAPSGS